RIHMARDVVAQIFAHESHQVVASVADMVFGLIFVPVHAHVAVDGIEALSNRPAAFDIGFLDADDLEIAPPITGLIGSPAAAHAAADDEDVRVHKDGLAPAHQTRPCLKRSRESAGSAATLSDSGSCASSCDFIASALGAAYSDGDLIESHGVVRIGDTKFFSRPSRDLIFHEIVALSSSRRTRTLWPSGAKSA